MSFDKAFEKVVGIEGKYSNDPNDSGGETMYGITVQVARANGYMGAMKEMPLSTAKHIYKRQYWDVLRFDEIDPVSPAIADELFDTGVNCGVAVAATFLQRTLNVLNRQQADFPDLKVDGVLGPVSTMTLRTYLAKRAKDGEKVVLRALNSLQGARYIELAERREKDETFVNGWLINRVA